MCWREVTFVPPPSPAFTVVSSSAFAQRLRVTRPSAASTREHKEKALDAGKVSRASEPLSDSQIAPWRPLGQIRAVLEQLRSRRQAPNDTLASHLTKYLTRSGLNERLGPSACAERRKFWPFCGSGDVCRVLVSPPGLFCASSLLPLCYATVWNHRGGNL